MPKVIFIDTSEKQYVVDAAVGQTMMQVATDNLVPGIIGECGGCCNCGTCHVYVDPEWLGRLTQASLDEVAMLDGSLETKDNSRLSCQIKLEKVLDGIVVRLPESPY